MGYRKTESFESISSPLNIGDKKGRTNKSGNLQADWDRLSQQEDIYLNGKPLSSYRDKYQHFQNEQDVQSFFKNEILDKMSINDQEKEKTVAYLTLYFQQAGFMFPVSNTLVFSMFDLKLGEGVNLMISNKNFTEQRINIETTKEGFSIQEFVKVSKFTAMQNKNTQDFLPDDPDDDHVIKAQGKISFDFRKDSNDPAINVLSNTISYGHSKLRELMDTRSFGQKILDFLAHLFKFNQVNVADNHSKPAPQSPSIEEESPAEKDDHSAGPHF